MTASLLSLPRELRDQIYKYVLISTTGFIEPREQGRREKSSSSANSTHRFVLFHYETYTETAGELCKSKSFSISLLRTCRQIHAETKDLFWQNNTFVFSSPILLTKSLKTMGQISSRLITRIHLLLDYVACRCEGRTKALAKALRLLASRARHGSFKQLALHIDASDIRRLSRLRETWVEEEQQLYDDFLETLRNGSASCKFQRSFEVTDRGGLGVTVLRLWKPTLKELNFAWGGTFAWNGIVLLEDYDEVSGQL